MKSLLEEMYYNNFTVRNDSKKKYDEERKLIALLDKNEQKLKERLEKEDIEVLEKIIDCYEEILSLESCEYFKSGFRMGGRMVTEMFFGEYLNIEN